MTILPCPVCPDVQFCSQDCLFKSLQGHHKYECRMRLYGILRALNRNTISNEISVGKIVALRLITQKDPRFFDGQRHTFEDLILVNPSGNKISRKNSEMDGYDDMLNLACVSIDKKRLQNHKDFATALLWLLQMSGYLQVDRTSFFFELILKVMCIIHQMVSPILLTNICYDFFFN